MHLPEAKLDNSWHLSLGCFQKLRHVLTHQKACPIAITKVALMPRWYKASDISIPSILVCLFKLLWVFLGLMWDNKCEFLECLWRQAPQYELEKSSERYRKFKNKMIKGSPNKTAEWTLGWSPTKYDSFPYKKKLGHKHTDRWTTM